VREPGLNGLQVALSERWKEGRLPVLGQLMIALHSGAPPTWGFHLDH